VRPAHDEANGVLEDEREEDPDEDDQERVADGAEGEADGDCGADDDDRPHRDEQLDAAHSARVHGRKL
jgi:hypothetical protein